MTLVEPNSSVAYDKHSPAKDLLIKALTDLPTVSLRTESTVEEVGKAMS